MSTDIILIITLVLLVLSIGINYLSIKYLSHFLNQIRTVKGIEVKTLESGKPAPLFRAFDERGEKVILKDLFNKKKTLVLFMKTSCPVCKSLLPSIKEITKHYDVNFLLINSDNTEDDQEITNHLQPGGVTYIRAPQIAQSYFIREYPYAVLIDNEGKIELHTRLKNFNGLWNMLINQKSVAL